jgi:hypothetical protein
VVVREARDDALQRRGGEGEGERAPDEDPDQPEKAGGLGADSRDRGRHNRRLVHVRQKHQIDLEGVEHLARPASASHVKQDLSWREQVVRGDDEKGSNP